MASGQCQSAAIPSIAGLGVWGCDWSGETYLKPQGKGKCIMEEAVPVLLAGLHGAERESSVFAAVAPVTGHTVHKGLRMSVSRELGDLEQCFLAEQYRRAASRPPLWIHT